MIVVIIVGSWAVLVSIGRPKEASGSFLQSFALRVFNQAESGSVQLLLIFTCLASAVYAVLLQRFPQHLKAQGFLQLSLDLGLVSWLVVVFGGIHSPFSTFYPLLIVIATLYLDYRKVGTTFATAALLLYTLILIREYGLPWQPELSPARQEDTIRLTYNMVVALFGFYGAAGLASQLARRTRQAELELAEKKGHLADLRMVYQDIIQSISSGLITTGLGGHITSINRAGLQILGISEHELLGQPIFHHLMSEELWHHFCSSCESPQRPRGEVQLVREGSVAYVGFSVSSLNDAEGARLGYILIFQDFTSNRQLLQELRIKDRMAGIGELAAGIAHELGNPLTAISGSAQLLASSFQGDASKLKLLQIILKESQRLDRTIKGFLKFARPRELAPVRFDVAAQLAENFTLLSNSSEVSEHHQLHLDLEPRSAFIRADPDQISQIFWNLVRNALQAMPNGGVLRVAGRQLADGGYRLMIVDSGKGMREEERARLFQPFHSFFDGGTGIGMAIVYRIVQEHDGRLQVESQPDHGTTIIIELPALPPEVPAVAAPGQPSMETAR